MLDRDVHPRFEWLVNRAPQQGTLVYSVFDLLRVGSDLNLLHMPIRERKQRLARILKNNDKLRYVDHLETEGLALYAGALDLGLEGIVAKESLSPYVEGPRVTGHWLKVKNKDYQRKEKVKFAFPAVEWRRRLRQTYRIGSASRFDSTGEAPSDRSSSAVLSSSSNRKSTLACTDAPTGHRASSFCSSSFRFNLRQNRPSSLIL